jgi:hypothetical protein
MKRILFCVIAIAFFGLASAYADNPQPLLSPFSNGNYTITAGGFVNGVNIDQGGAFYGTIQLPPNPAISTSSETTAFWCVDDQLFFGPPQTGNANILTLDTVATAPANTVQYQNVGAGVGNPDWLNQNLGVLGNATLTQRYEMAAWLIAQYESPAGSSEPIPDLDSTYNQEVQNAIWALTSTTCDATINPTGCVPPNESGASHVATLYNPVTNPNGLDAESLALLTQAENKYTSVNADLWAVVSWQTLSNTDPALGTGEYNTSGGASQTFLVEITGGTTGITNFVPEPGFYGLLALGMSGLAFALNRRKKNA